MSFVRRLSRRTIALAAALFVSAAAATGTTIAWLMDTTGDLQNTFTFGQTQFGIALGETTGDRYEMLPGKTLSKDPAVTVPANTESCWLFVEIIESSTLDQYIAYAADAGWQPLTAGGAAVPGVYVREYAKAAQETVYPVLEGNQVRVREDVTLEDLTAVKNGTVEAPTLTFRATAVQREGLDSAEAAWAACRPVNP